MRLLWEVCALKLEGKSRRDKGNSICVRAKNVFPHPLFIFIYVKAITWIRSKEKNKDRSMIEFYLEKITTIKCTQVHIKMCHVTPYLFRSHTEKQRNNSMMGLRSMFTFASCFGKTKAAHVSRRLDKLLRV